MNIDGQCHCGHVRYEAEIDAGNVSVCHCTDCQMLTGTAFRVTAFAKRGAVRLTGGPPKLYIKVADNGRNRLQYFCPECGSPLFTTGEDEDAALWGIRWGSIRQREELRPDGQVWCRSAQPWVGGIERLPGREAD